MVKSAGILLYRINKHPEVLLVHPGGPFWKNKDLGAWSMPKGEFTDEDPGDAAVREFQEETGFPVTGRLLALDPVKQKSGKVIYPFAAEGDLDETKIISNHFTLEWPPRSGKIAEFPEVDRAGWFGYEEAITKINAGQVPALNDLFERMKWK